MNEFDASKLPKYAQERIRILERTISELKEKLEALQSNAPSRIFYGGFVEEPHFLPTGSRISFQLSDDPKRIVRAYIQEEQLEISSPTGAILVQPWVTNVVKIIQL